MYIFKFIVLYITMKFTGWGHTHSLIHTDKFLTPLDRAWQQGGAMS